jgi:hypothetical protein
MLDLTPFPENKVTGISCIYLAYALATLEELEYLVLKLNMVATQPMKYAMK